MQEIDVLLDDQPNLSLELIELDIRNKQAHEELQSFNDTSAFLYKYQLTINKRYFDTQLTELTALKNENPELFINEITNITQNIRRIESNISTRKYKSEEELKRWKQNLSRAEIRSEIIKQIIKS